VRARYACLDNFSTLDLCIQQRLAVTSPPLCSAHLPTCLHHTLHAVLHDEHRYRGVAVQLHGVDFKPDLQNVTATSFHRLM